jgi:hypothetical protein
MNRSMLCWSTILVGCSEYAISDPKDVDGVLTSSTASATTPADTCGAIDKPAEELGVIDACEDPEAGFEPIVEWSYGSGKSSRATVSVGDLDHDGLPEIVANVGLLFGSGDLVVLNGDGTELWTAPDTLGYGSSPAMGDLDGDGWAEIVVVREYQSSMFAAGDYTAVAYDAFGVQIWESAHFVGEDFDYATAPILADLDHDGSAEVVLGRVILRADGTTRGVGVHGRGSWGIIALGGFSVSEASVPAVADIDLDGVQEVITGNAVYGPDGEVLWHDSGQADGMIAIGNLDADPEGEFVAASFNTVRAVDTDGSVMWGPMTLQNANIVSPPCIGDLDGDGQVEIVVAGGNHIVALHADGSLLWSSAATDLTGASGASLFDFEGDGVPEVVYIDEVEMIAFDGPTGAVKFYSREHASDTMMDYPVIADVDGDNHAEIVVGHAGWNHALSVYGDLDDTWAPARKVWNQHAYSVTNINDDLTIPTTPVENFTTLNTWHAALGDQDLLPVDHEDLQAEILERCALECAAGRAVVWGRVINRSPEEVAAGIDVALYAVVGRQRTLLAVVQTPDPIPAGWTSEPLEFDVDATLADGATRLEMVADDDGTSQGAVPECLEGNNLSVLEGPVCP